MESLPVESLAGEFLCNSPFGDRMATHAGLVVRVRHWLACEDGCTARYLAACGGTSWCLSQSVIRALISAGHGIISRCVCAAMHCCVTAQSIRYTHKHCGVQRGTTLRDGGYGLPVPGSTSLAGVVGVVPGPESGT